MKDHLEKIKPTQSDAKMAKFTFMDFNREFPNQESCMKYLVSRRYPDGMTCKKCERVRGHSYLEGRSCYTCNMCGTHTHPTAGTIFHKSRTPLTTWFYAIFVLSNTRGGVSAKQIERDTGVTYKTAWRMCTLIRSRLDENKDPFGGDDVIVEVDETYYGAKTKEGKRGRGSENKKPVIGIVERGGRVHAKLVPDVKKVTLQGEIKELVTEGTEVYTDEHLGYYALQSAGYTHMTINHGAKEYATIDGVHTNTIEGFWGNFKMGVKGAHHFVSHKYLNGYLAEHGFRYNHRNDTKAMFWSMLDQMWGESAHLKEGKLNVV